ncbi:MAG: helix-turn-helix domain-containing protein [Xanthobacteraceae bacterium]|nr:helix-turn-helix domain-containing protein [Xanthobacteraceae bacterium]
MKTLKVGIAGYQQYKSRTMAIARGEFKPAADGPKIWFRSIESFARILSDKNRELLALIAETKPDSMNELAERTGRARSNLSRTLRTMERYGLVRFEKGSGRQLAPRVPYTDIVLDMPLGRSPGSRAASV